MYFYCVALLLTLTLITVAGDYDIDCTTLNDQQHYDFTTFLQLHNDEPVIDLKHSSMLNWNILKACWEDIRNITIMPIHDAILPWYLLRGASHKMKLLQINVHNVTWNCADCANAWMSMPMQINLDFLNTRCQYCPRDSVFNVIENLPTLINRDRACDSNDSIEWFEENCDLFKTRLQILNDATRLGCSCVTDDCCLHHTYIALIAHDIQRERLNMNIVTKSTDDSCVREIFVNKTTLRPIDAGYLVCKHRAPVLVPTDAILATIIEGAPQIVNCLFMTDHVDSDNGKQWKIPMGSAVFRCDLLAYPSINQKNIRILYSDFAHSAIYTLSTNKTERKIAIRTRSKILIHSLSNHSIELVFFEFQKECIYLGHYALEFCNDYGCVRESARVENKNPKCNLSQPIDPSTFAIVLDKAEYEKDVFNNIFPNVKTTANPLLNAHLDPKDDKMEILRKNDRGGLDYFILILLVLGILLAGSMIFCLRWRPWQKVRKTTFVDPSPSQMINLLSADMWPRDLIYS